MTESRIPVACTLSEAGAERRLAEWADLQQLSLGTEALADGARLILPASVADELDDLVARERQCCAFLAITTTEKPNGTLELEIRSPDPAGLPTVLALAGLSEQ